MTKKKKQKKIAAKPKKAAAKPKPKKKPVKPAAPKKKYVVRKPKRVREFKKGEPVVYPFHGVGKVIKIEVREVLGNKEKYYLIFIEGQDMTVMVPVSKVDILKLRPLCEMKLLEKALRILKTTNEEAEIDWKLRLADNIDKIKTGDIIKVAEVARDLHQRDKELGLSSGDKRVYRTAKQLVVEETALIKKISKEDAFKLIDTNLKEVEPEELFSEYYRESTGATDTDDADDT